MNDDRVVDFFSGDEGFFNSVDGDGFCDRDVNFFKSFGEEVMVFRYFEGFDIGIEDVDVVFFEEIEVFYLNIKV